MLDLSKKKTFGQALLFALVILIIGALLGGIISGLVVTLSNSVPDFNSGYQLGLRVGHITSIVFYTALSIAIIVSKKIVTNPLAIIMALLSIAGAILMGGVLGTIPVFVLAMLSPKEI